MDKKKVKELIEYAEKLFDEALRNGGIDGYKNKLLAKHCLKDALNELSKSDWVSVEDGLPPYGEAVRVRSKQHPNDFMLAYRIDENTMKTIYPHKCYSCDVTHWKPIEKLEV